MFITQAQEIIEACPTAKIDDDAAERLIRSVEEEEEQMLDTLLGQRLISALVTDYISLVAAHDGITTDCIDLTSVDDDTKKRVRMLRAIQSALVYRMLANKLYGISTSINLGGGANRAAADNYEPADDKHMQELRREYYHNSRRMCDNILVMLERDAHESSPLWLDLWRESDGYYYKEDLLFPTMRSLKPFYAACKTSIGFLDLFPTIRYCQDTYIAPRVDGDLLARLVDETATLTAEERLFQKYLRTALAYYVMSKEAQRDERNAALQAADNAMSTAQTYFDRHLAPPSPIQPAPKNVCACQKKEDAQYDTFTTLLPGLHRW